MSTCLSAGGPHARPRADVPFLKDIPGVDMDDDRWRSSVASASRVMARHSAVSGGVAASLSRIITCGAPGRGHGEVILTENEVMIARLL